jgi:hypothetical protein
VLRAAGSPGGPAGSPDGRVEPWAWFVTVPDEGSVDSSPLAADTDPRTPLRRGNDVFHPPRFLLPI